MAYDTGCGGRGLYITRSCKDVEAAYKLLAYAYGEEGMKLLMWGIEGEDYTVDSEGYPDFTYGFSGGQHSSSARGLKYWGWLVHNAIVTSIAEANSESQTAQDRKNLTAYVKRNPVIGMIRFVTDSDEANINAKLDEMVKNQQTNILWRKPKRPVKKHSGKWFSRRSRLVWTGWRSLAIRTIRN